MTITFNEDINNNKNNHFKDVREKTSCVAYTGMVWYGMNECLHTHGMCWAEGLCEKSENKDNMRREN